MKKIIVIMGFILIIGAVGYYLYSKSQKDKQSTPGAKAVKKKQIAATVPAPEKVEYIDGTHIPVSKIKDVLLKAKKIELRQQLVDNKKFTSMEDFEENGAEWIVSWAKTEIEKHPNDVEEYGGEWEYLKNYSLEWIFNFIIENEDWAQLSEQYKIYPYILFNTINEIGGVQNPSLAIKDLHKRFGTPKQ